MRVAILIMALFLASCAGVLENTMPEESTSLDGWTIQYTTHAKIYDVCKGLSSTGCTVYETKTIYCVKWSYRSCGHELMHITDRAWHK